MTAALPFLLIYEQLVVRDRALVWERALLPVHVEQRSTRSPGRQHDSRPTNAYLLSTPPFAENRSFPPGSIAGYAHAGCAPVRCPDTTN